MVANQPLANRYREVEVKTANPLELVVILYDGAIHSLQQALEQLKQNDVAGRSRSINRFVALLSQLQASLNFDEGGAIASSLDRLYTYMKERVFQANVGQKSEPLHEVINLLQNLRSAWQELAAQVSTVEIQGNIANAQLVKAETMKTQQLTTLNISG